jgi:predicted GNAT family N-acyltransferase
MGAVGIEVRWARASDELVGAVRVREEVFCVEQGVPRADELDGRDGEAMHIVALEPAGRVVIATLRLLLEDGAAKIGRVAVQRSWRGRGIASRMIAVALSRARELGCSRARLASQVEVRGLYEQAGFVVESDVFDSAGIPHVWMGLALGIER